MTILRSRRRVMIRKNVASIIITMYVGGVRVPISIIFIILLAIISNVAKVQACMIVTESSNAVALVNIKKN